MEIFTTLWNGNVCTVVADSSNFTFSVFANETEFLSDQVKLAIPLKGDDGLMLTVSRLEFALTCRK